MKNIALLLFGPTIMIFIGLIVFQNVPVTFALFYGWLFFIPFLSDRNAIRKIIHNNRSSIWVGLISGILCLCAIYGAVFFLKESVFDLSALRQLLIDWNFTGANVIWLVLVLIFINPILEELYWREFMYGRLEGKVGAAKTIVITAFFYSLYHLLSVYFLFSFPFNILAVFFVFLAGLMWGFFRYKLQSTTASIISHVLSDLGIMLVYLNFIL